MRRVTDSALHDFQEKRNTFDCEVAMDVITTKIGMTEV